MEVNRHITHRISTAPGEIITDEHVLNWVKLNLPNLVNEGTFQADISISTISIIEGEKR